MKTPRFFRDPVILAIFAFVAVVSGSITFGLIVGSDHRGFSEACRTMGGVPLIGHSGTKICFKDSVVLSVN